MKKGLRLRTMRYYGWSLIIYFIEELQYLLILALVRRSKVDEEKEKIEKFFYKKF